jgi:hypothetical protein
MPMNNSNLIFEYISYYGFRVFPLNSVDEENHCTCRNIKCNSAGKHPVLKGSWKKYATNNKETITRWKSDYKNINFALLTGTYSEQTKKYLIVIDVDASEHTIIDSLPKTFYYKTGSGGYHFWYWSDFLIKNSVNLIEDKVDVRGKGGYIVIPPARNKHGNYEFLEDSFNEINNFPIELLNNIKYKQKEATINKQTKEKVKKEDKIFNFIWSKYSIKEIREKILEGEKIPKGLRNVVIHKLLSSDRAKGAVLNDLVNNSEYYYDSLENKESFSKEELKNIVYSVLKYPIYNQDHNNVIKGFVEYNKKLNDSYKETENTIKQIDDLFFNSLVVGDYECSIQNLIKQRQEFYKKFNIINYPHYRVQLLSKKLIELGFQKLRTNKNNLWNIHVNDSIQK